MSWVKRKDEDVKQKLVYMVDEVSALSEKYDSMIFEEDEEDLIEKAEPSKEK